MNVPDLSGFPYKLQDILRRIISAINHCPCRSCQYNSGDDGGGTSSGSGSGGPSLVDPNPLPTPAAYEELTISGNITLGDDAMNKLLYITATTSGLTVNLPSSEMGTSVKVINAGTNSFYLGTSLVYAGQFRSAYTKSDGSMGVAEPSMPDV